MNRKEQLTKTKQLQDFLLNEFPRRMFTVEPFDGEAGGQVIVDDKTALKMIDATKINTFLNNLGFNEVVVIIESNNKLCIEFLDSTSPSGLLEDAALEVDIVLLDEKAAQSLTPKELEQWNIIKQKIML